MRIVLPTLESTRRVAGAWAKSMNASTSIACQPATCELRFQSLFDAGRSYAFPCDAIGNVDMDSLSDKACANYLYVRTLIGREFARPTVMISAGQ
jgi:hypothetical protein